MDKNLEKLGERSKEMESVRAIERKRLAIERTCDRTQTKEIDHSTIDRRPTAIERTYA